MLAPVAKYYERRGAKQRFEIFECCTEVCWWREDSWMCDYAEELVNARPGESPRFTALGSFTEQGDCNSVLWDFLASRVDEDICV